MDTRVLFRSRLVLSLLPVLPVLPGLALVGLARPAAAAPDNTSAAPAPRVDAQGRLIRGPASCGTPQYRPPILGATPYIAPAIPATPPATQVIYLNKNGGTYHINSGATNAATSTANIAAAGDNRTHANAVIPPIDSSFNWPHVVTCVRQQYQPYNVLVTETRPTSGSYVEAVVGGDGASTGWSASSGILGVAAADNFCGVTQMGIAFSFATNHVGIAQADDELCATIAHEVGHLLALEHEATDTETMSYVPFAQAGSKLFTSANGQCGTDAQTLSSCSCPTTGSGQVTNSSLRLKQYVGVRSTDAVPPTLVITAPSANATVGPSFAVTATATDDKAMDRVDVVIDGATKGTSSAPQGGAYTVTVSGVAVGTHTVEVQAYDAAGNVTKKTVAITVALTPTGGTCTGNDQCEGGVCALTSPANFCTEACDLTASTCPAGFTCQAISGGATLCVPSGGGGGGGSNAANGGGGGCASTSSDGRTLTVLLGLGLVALVKRRRR
jgi:hypothetical protein